MAFSVRMAKKRDGKDLKSGKICEHKKKNYCLQFGRLICHLIVKPLFVRESICKLDRRIQQIIFIDRTSITIGINEVVKKWQGLDFNSKV